MVGVLRYCAVLFSRLRLQISSQHDHKKITYKIELRLLLLVYKLLDFDQSLTLQKTTRYLFAIWGKSLHKNYRHIHILCNSGLVKRNGSQSNRPFFMQLRSSFH